ncbi:ribokinase [Conyzicola sp.]|uniref:ribokinase n=1 Tax=Conyzicola sp. TaxID=1969404 RepID=UPI00398927BA
MGSTVFVFGSINADTSYRVAKLPAAGETVLASSALESPGGKGANQAIAAAAAGSVTRMVGAVGDDSIAVSLLAALQARGVDTGAVSTIPGADTGRAVVYVDDAAENSIVVLSGANNLVDGSVAGSGLDALARGDVLVLQSEVPAAANRAAARLARAAGAVVIWNAAPAPSTADDLVREIDLLVVNQHELVLLGSILGLPPVQDDADDAALPALLSATARELGTDAICTLGSAGAVYVVDGQTGTVAAPTVRAVDTTAAGDTVVGYLAAHSDLPIDRRLRLANSAGALTVTRAGASSSIPQLGEVEEMLAALTERTPA